jgi:predicted O-methyltransferase YrrM
MGLIFRVPRTVIDNAIEQLKSDGLVHPQASFNLDAENGLRREVTYRDEELLRRIGNTGADIEVVDAALDLLKSERLVPDDAGYDKERFARFREKVKSSFKGAWTSITPSMERLMYMLTAVRRPKRLVEFGCFWGNTLAWFSGPCIGEDREYAAEAVYGVDIEEEMVELARENFARLGGVENVELIAEDARDTIDRLRGPLDFVYIEAKSGKEQGLYLTLLKKVYEKLAPKAWVIAHNASQYTSAEIREYLEWVRDKRHFSESIWFDIDSCGLELSVR